MTRFIKKTKAEIGLSPDELVFRGEQKVDKVSLSYIDFDSNYLTEGSTKTVKEISEYPKKDSITWLNVDGLHNRSILEDISLYFKLDTCIIPEVLNLQSRPRVVEYDNCILITLKILQKDEISGVTSIENLSLILLDSVLISFQENKGDIFEPIREQIRKEKKRIRNGSTDYLSFALLDTVIDNYLHVISLLGENIEPLEETILLHPNDNVINEINNYKRELNFFRKNIKPAKEMIFSLAKLDTDLIKDSNAIHFKELQDNISQASDATDSYRDILSDQLNIYHTIISTKLNDTMKFLTVFSVIFIPLTFITGIYGTNFENLPELHYKYGYFTMLGGMLVIVLLMLLYFRKKKWL